MEVFKELHGQTVCLYCRDKSEAQFLFDLLDRGTAMAIGKDGKLKFDSGLSLRRRVELTQAVNGCKYPVIKFALQRKLEGTLTEREFMTVAEYLRGLDVPPDYYLNLLRDENVHNIDTP